MNKNILFFSILFFPAIIFSQSFDLSKNNLRIKTPESKNAQAAKDLHRTLNNGLKKSFNVHNQSVFTIYSTISINADRKMEGVQVLEVADVTVDFQIDNSITNEIKEWTYKGQGKGETESKAIANAFKLFQSSDSGLKEWGDSIGVYIKDEINSRCLTYIRKAEEAAGTHDVAQALLILNNIKNDSECSNAKRELEEKITAMHGKEFCEASMKKIKFMASSTTVLQLENVMQELIMVPPNAPCATEALDIAKQINSNLAGRSEKTQMLIKHFETMHLQNRWEGWFEYFLKRKLGGR